MRVAVAVRLLANCCRRKLTPISSLFDCVVIVLQAIAASFRELSLEASASCQYDNVSLYDGACASSLLLGTYCTAVPNTVTPFSSSVFVVFQSDSNFNDGRFALRWTTFVNPSSQGSTGHKHSSVNFASLTSFKRSFKTCGFVSLFD